MENEVGLSGQTALVTLQSLRSALPTPIGFLAKQTKRRPDPPIGDVEEICSVSCCLSKAPPGSISLWCHHAMGFYASEALALSVIPPRDDRTDYDVYAYAMLPVAFDEDGEPRALSEDESRALSEAAKDAEEISGDYELLGWDIVSNSLGWVDSQSFECSPLTCNSLAGTIPANRYGLIDGLDAAFAAAPEIIRSPAEPGPYYLVQVWRKAK
jgi:hypothetical protein